MNLKKMINNDNNLVLESDINEKCVDCKHLCVDDCDLLIRPIECNLENIGEMENIFEKRRQECLEDIKKNGIYRKDTEDF